MSASLTKLEEYQVHRILSAVEGEPNTAETRARIKQQLSGVFKGALAENRYKIICDESNNSPVPVNQNKLSVDILLKRTYGSEYIRISHTV